jgi:hypothetical protein
MKLNKWSVVRTADAKGLALKPTEGGAQQYEVCVALRNGALGISVHVEGVDAPIARMEVPVENNFLSVPKGLVFAPPRSIPIVDEIRVPVDESVRRAISKLIVEGKIHDVDNKTK